uniref:Uncharacterized protein n=1 Tax=Branchiostoma floridae TaxID=7739 RepID=C3ZXP6_BRAFL|eukprot:XP_002586698.1 hypothetical protein BRAFLDRAFT_105504 [Branchiostoma floridae]
MVWLKSQGLGREKGTAAVNQAVRAPLSVTAWLKHDRNVHGLDFDEPSQQEKPTLVHVQYPSDKGTRVKKMGGRLKSGVQQLADGKWGAAAGSLWNMKIWLQRCVIKLLKQSDRRYRNSLVLLHAGEQKIAFTRLNKQQLCMSHTMSILKQTELGKGRDDEILAWKLRVEAHLETVPLLNAVREELERQEQLKSKADPDASGQNTISSADLQALDFAFQTYDSPEQLSSSMDDSDLDPGVMPLSEEDTDTTTAITEVLNSIPGFKDETYKLAEQAINSAEVTTEDRPQGIVSKAIEVAAETPL